MKKVLFIVTELQKPVGGLYRFTIEYLQAWRELINEKKTDFEPIVFSLKDPFLPTDDLVLSKEFSFMKGLAVYEAVRGGERVFFLESKLNQQEQGELFTHLWNYYGIPSDVTSSTWDYYNVLASFWKNMTFVAEYLHKQKKISCIDCQDWLAFPAGFLIKEKLGIPLHCRYHSGEFGRSMGKPDYASAPVNIEAAALMQADFVQAVSVTEIRFELYRLLPLKQDIVRRVSKFHDCNFLIKQHHKDRHYEEFLLFEPEDLSVIGENAAGMTNGIILDEWKQVTKTDIENGRKMLQKILPGKKKYALFVGRTEYRKGLSTLIDAFAYVKNPDVGLILASSFSEETKNEYNKKIRGLGLEKSVLIHDGWISEKVKKSLFCAADIIALPSLYEPFGLVTLEALAADLACEKNHVTGPTVIVGDTGGMREIIKNGVNGFKSPMLEDLFQLNPEYLSRIMEMILENEKLRVRISQGGAHRVQNKYFNWKFIVEAITGQYEAAIENYSFYEKNKGECMNIEEVFGENAGKVWLALKDSNPLSDKEIATKTKLGRDEVNGALGWLAREGKIAINAEGKTMKYALA